MTPEQIAGLEALLEQATPGPWSSEIEADPEFEMPAVYVCHPQTVCDVTVVATMGQSLRIPQQRKEADAHLIALAPTLARHVLTQQAQITRLEKALHAIANGNPTIDRPEDDAANSAAIARAALKGGDA